MEVDLGVVGDGDESTHRQSFVSMRCGLVESPRDELERALVDVALRIDRRRRRQ